MLKHLALALALFTSAACSSSSGSSTGGITPTGDKQGFGTLTLTGSDAAALGGAMEVGDVACTFDAAGELIALTFVDPSSVILADEYTFPDQLDPLDIVPGSLTDFTIFTVTEDLTSGFSGISMAITKAGLKYPYLCTNPVASSILCGSLVIDRSAQSITFVDVTVTPGTTPEAATGVLTLNGVITWL